MNQGRGQGRAKSDPATSVGRGQSRSGVCSRGKHLQSNVRQEVEREESEFGGRGQRPAQQPSQASEQQGAIARAPCPSGV